jgi:hypothetical protein
MSADSSTPVRFFIPASLFLSVLGWGGVILLVFNTFPTVGPRWLFFFMLVLALAGTFLPAIAFFNRRFPSTPPSTPAVVIRQATWVGLFGATVAWLQIGRVLTSPMIILLVVGFGLVEFLLRLSEKSRWEPPRTADPDKDPDG